MNRPAPLLHRTCPGRSATVDASVPPEGGTIFKKGARPDYKIDHETGCWNWLKSIAKTGYPQGRWYRRYYELAHGPIPAGFHVHHECENRRCVNPDHLRAISPDEHFIQHYLHARGRSLDTVRAIREAGRQPGASQSEIGIRFGVDRTTVRNYWIDFCWARLLGEDGPVVTPPAPCKVCGEPAIGKYRNRRFCCERCRMDHNNRLTVERNRRRKAETSAT